MRKIGFLSVIVCLAVASGCSLCCFGKRETELLSPTDIRQTHFWCLGEDALFHYPCGPNREAYGLKQTQWREWEGGDASWASGPCYPSAEPMMPFESDRSYLPAPEEQPPTADPAWSNPFRDDAANGPTPAQEGEWQLSPSERAESGTRSFGHAERIDSAAEVPSFASGAGSNELHVTVRHNAPFGDASVPASGGIIGTGFLDKTALPIGTDGGHRGTRVSPTHYPVTSRPSDGNHYHVGNRGGPAASDIAPTGGAIQAAFLSPQPVPSTPKVSGADQFRAAKSPQHKRTPSFTARDGAGFQSAGSNTTFTNPYLMRPPNNHDDFGKRAQDVAASLSAACADGRSEGVTRRQHAAGLSTAAPAAVNRPQEGATPAARREHKSDDVPNHTSVAAKTAAREDETLAALERYMSDTAVNSAAGAADNQSREAKTLAALKRLMSEEGGSASVK